MKKKISFYTLIILCYLSTSSLTFQSTDGCKKVFDLCSQRYVFIKADVLPSFNNNSSIGNYLIKKIKASIEEYNDIEYSLKIEFIVEKDGTINYVRFKERCDEENYRFIEKQVIGIIQKMPKWEGV